MSGGGHEGEPEVPWPAFVDLLTSVLITFMFFILITTVAMSTMTMKAAKDEVEKQTKKEDHKSDSKAEPVLAPPSIVADPALQTVSQLQARNAALEDEVTKLKQNMASLQVPMNKATEIQVQDETPTRMKVIFKRNEIGMLPEIAKQIITFINGWETSNGSNMVVQLTALEPDTLSQSQAREQALARALNVRNVLLVNGVNPKAITVKYVPFGKTTQGTDWVQIEIRKVR